MISALQPLADLPGVNLVMMVTHDGVPIAVPGKSHPVKDEDGDGFLTQALGREDVFAALAVGWLGELERAIAELSWHTPRRAVLKSTRGTLVMHRTDTAVLLVLLARGLGPEEVRLSMEGTIARIERGLKNMGKRSHASTAPLVGNPAEHAALPDPPAVMPSLQLPDDESFGEAEEHQGEESFG